MSHNLDAKIGQIRFVKLTQSVPTHCMSRFANHRNKIDPLEQEKLFGKIFYQICIIADYKFISHDSFECSGKRSTLWSPGINQMKSGHYSDADVPDWQLC